jgi:hypothetical protein
VSQWPYEVAFSRRPLPQGFDLLQRVGFAYTHMIDTN